MDPKECGCNDAKRPDSCPGCRAEEIIFPYWCDTCRRAVPEKRCPHCGLKAKKKS